MISRIVCSCLLNKTLPTAGLSVQLEKGLQFNAGPFLFLSNRFRLSSSPDDYGAATLTARPLPPPLKLCVSGALGVNTPTFLPVL